MDFNKTKTSELIEIYEQIKTFIKFLEKENEEIQKWNKNRKQGVLYA